MSAKITTTVVIPCYNDGAYIRETVASVNAQTAKDIEIIIVDDASTDEGTKEILKSFDQENLTVCFLEKNGGPSVARNKAISQARGEFILPLDADDKIAPTYIEKAQAVLRKDPDIGIVYCKAELFGRKTGPWKLPPYAFPQILTDNMIFATALYRKEDWKRVGGYNENMREGNEDYDFWLSLIELGRGVYQIPETLFFYRIRTRSRTTRLHSNLQNEIDTYEQIFYNHEKLYRDNIRIFFETLKQRQEKLNEKNREIRLLHRRLHQYEKKLDEVGRELTYAQSVVALRDKQVQSMRIKNRIKRLMKRISPFHHAEKEVWDEPKPSDTGTAYTYCQPVLTEEVKEKMANFEKKPLLSIVMPVYNVDPKWLDLALKSIEAQWYENWELCIADDKSTNPQTLAFLKSIDNPKVKITFMEKNLNISGATNKALETAEGEYIVLMDNDDEITPDALYEVVRAVNEHGADFIYSDEDFIDTEGVCQNPHFKPDFSPDLLLSHNYITHLAAFRRSLLDEAGYFNSRFDGSQDYDLFLRLTERAMHVHHIPKVLYHWRMIEGSTSADSSAKPEAIERGKKVLEETLARRGIEGTVEHANLHHYFRVRYAIKGEPLVSIIIPFKDKPELLDMCINSILEKSTYQNYEIIGISNNSEEAETFRMMKVLEQKDPRVRFYEYNVPFNYAQINNHAVNTYARGEQILLLNNDIEVITPDWIEAMLEHSQREEVGCVGAKLYYPNDTVQHAGIIVGLGGYAGHSHKMYPRGNPGYFNRLMIVQNVSAVTAACLMVEKRIYDEVGGMDEEKFKVAYNDVDFCLRVHEKGYLNIYTPYAEMYHHESVSRGYETTPEKLNRFKAEKNALLERHFDILMDGDPYYNPNLSYDREDFSVDCRCTQ